MTHPRPSLAKLLAEVAVLIAASSAYCTNNEADRAQEPRP